MSRKKQYRIRNWPEYNKALVNRGSLTVWFDEKSIAEWHNTQPSGQRGRPFDYSDTAILCALTLRNLFRLPLRATEGFIASLIELLRLPMTAPDYTTLSRRQSSLDIPIYKKNNRGPIHLVVDSSGIKIYGEGEWKIRLYDKEKRRTWRKLHIAVNEGKRLRNHAVSRVREWGLKKWKIKNNYHRRSMAETAFLRLKKIFGASAASRTFDNQVVELTLRCNILNRMNQLGMPDSVMI